MNALDSRIRVIALLTACVGICQITGAATIGVNFTRPTAGSNSLPSIEPTDIAGVHPAANWNNIASDSQVGSATTTSGLIDDSGSATAASITYFQRFWLDMPNTTSANGILNSGYTNTSDTANGTITVSGLGTEFTSGGYDVIVYLGGTNNMGAGTAAEFGVTVGGSTQWIRYVRPATGATQPDTFSSTPFATEDEAQDSASSSNYIRITGLTDSGFELTILKDPDSTALWSRAALRGIQIVAVPEPSSFLLAGLGSLAFFRRRR